MLVRARARRISRRSSSRSRTRDPRDARPRPRLRLARLRHPRPVGRGGGPAGWRDRLRQLQERRRGASGLRSRTTLLARLGRASESSSESASRHGDKAMTIGILAYGSLLDDPGTELASAVRRIDDTRDPIRHRVRTKSSQTRRRSDADPVENRRARGRGEYPGAEGQQSTSRSPATCCTGARPAMSGPELVRSRGPAGFALRTSFRRRHVPLHRVPVQPLRLMSAHPTAWHDLAIKSAARPAGAEQARRHLLSRSGEASRDQNPFDGVSTKRNPVADRCSVPADAWARARASGC